MRVRACVRVCMYVCVHACMRVCIRAHTDQCHTCLNYLVGAELGHFPVQFSEEWIKWTPKLTTTIKLIQTKPSNPTTQPSTQVTSPFSDLQNKPVLPGSELLAADVDVAQADAQVDQRISWCAVEHRHVLACCT